MSYGQESGLSQWMLHVSLRNGVLAVVEWRGEVLKNKGAPKHCTLKVKVKSLSCVRRFGTPWTVAYQAPPSMGFSRQEYWSGLPFPSPGESSRPRDRTLVSCIPGRHFNLWATSEVLTLYINDPQIHSGPFKSSLTGEVARSPEEGNAWRFKELSRDFHCCPLTAGNSEFGV